MSVTGVDDGDTRGEIRVAIAIDVPNIDPFAAVDDDG
jgi:hypothetical protein